MSNTQPMYDWKSCLLRAGGPGISVFSGLLGLESLGPTAHCMASLHSAVLAVELFAHEHWHRDPLVSCLMLSSAQLMFFLQTDECISKIKMSSSLKNHTLQWWTSVSWSKLWEILRSEVTGNCLWLDMAYQCLLVDSVFKSRKLHIQIYSFSWENSRNHGNTPQELRSRENVRGYALLL